MCGNCNDDPENDCVEDCAGIWGGISELDECGVCDADASNDNSTCIPEMFEFEQSSLQAGYFFKEVTINGTPVSPDDWVGAFNLYDETKDGICEEISLECPDVDADGILSTEVEVCTGSRKWDTSLCNGGICSINIMGNDGYDYSAGYCIADDIPSFKIFDASENAYYDAIASEDIAWENNGLNILDDLNVVADCAGVPNGDSYKDECNVCDNNPSNDCAQDCSGEWGGDADFILWYEDLDNDGLGADDGQNLCTGDSTCVRIATGSGSGSGGTIDATVYSSSGDELISVLGQSYGSEVIVINQCFEEDIGYITVHNPTNDGWAGSLEVSYDGGNSYIYLDCIDCTGSGTSSSAFTVDGDPSMEWWNDIVVDTQCLDGATCTFSGLVDSNNDIEPDCATNDTDSCGVCAGGDADQDCNGDCFGSAVVDDCGVCGGDNSSCADCAGVPNGPNVEDMCGNCNDDPENDCILDCVANKVQNSGSARRDSKGYGEGWW